MYNVTIADDRVLEGVEAFYVVLSLPPEQERVVLSESMANITIIDDDSECCMLILHIYCHDH